MFKTLRFLTSENVMIPNLEIRRSRFSSFFTLPRTFLTLLISFSKSGQLFRRISLPLLLLLLKDVKKKIKRFYPYLICERKDFILFGHFLLSYYLVTAVLIDWIFYIRVQRSLFFPNNLLFANEPFWEVHKVLDIQCYKLNFPLFITFDLIWLIEVTTVS